MLNLVDYANNFDIITFGSSGCGKLHDFQLLIAITPRNDLGSLRLPHRPQMIFISFYFHTHVNNDMEKSRAFIFDNIFSLINFQFSKAIFRKISIYLNISSNGY